MGICVKCEQTQILETGVKCDGSLSKNHGKLILESCVKLKGSCVIWGYIEIRNILDSKYLLYVDILMQLAEFERGATPDKWRSNGFLANQI